MEERMIPYRCGRYVLDADRRVAPEPDLRAWSDFMQVPDRRRVGDDEIEEWRVSTVFLGVDHSFDAAGGPVLFETMVFGPPGHGEEDEDHLRLERCRTWAEAEAQHARVLGEVRARWGSAPA